MVDVRIIFVLPSLILLRVNDDNDLGLVTAFNYVAVCTRKHIDRRKSLYALNSSRDQANLIKNKAGIVCQVNSKF